MARDLAVTGPYPRAFYEAHRESGFASARAVVPLLRALLEPRSVLDVGCGLGAWLAAFREAGVDDVLGLDGDHVPRDALAIPADRFVATDLSRGVPPGRAFDLALCLEVAEHLPADAGDRLVDGLCGRAEAVLFGAAIPGQGGEHHVNEQWPAYWAARFAARGYVAFDVVRPRVWDDPRVAVWYAQNAVLYVRADAVPRHPGLAGAAPVSPPLALVHPTLFAEARRHRAWSVLAGAQRLRRALRGRSRRRAP